MLRIPKISDENPKAGIRVRVLDEIYTDTQVHHILYLPTNWKKNKKHPVIVEFAGNCAPQFDSSGKVEDACLGYGLSLGENYIWVVMPFIAKDKKHNQLNWWGDEELSVRYCIDNVKNICDEYSGDIDNIFICGFSRGAIAVNYIGLYNDEIAELWKGFITHDHYDGIKEWKGTSWGYPLEKYRKSAEERIKRLKNRPSLIMQNPATDNIKNYIDSLNIKNDNIKYLDIPMKNIFNDIPNEFFPKPHTDKWILFNNKYSILARNWINNIVGFDKRCK